MALAASLLSVLALVGLSAPAAQLRTATAPQAKQTDARQAPSLNHIYIVLDQTTFDAIRDSRELAELLGRTDGGLPDYLPPPHDTDRIFFRGRHTYLELFAPNNRFGEPVGKVGVALGHDQPQRFEELAATWQATCGTRFRRTIVEYSRHQPPVPWYDAVQCDDTAGGPHLALWAMTYRPEFYRWQSGEKNASGARTARADVLASRVADGQGRFDITALSIDVSRAIYPALVRQLERAGMVRNGHHFSGEGWKLTLRAHDVPGLSSVTLATAVAPVRNVQLGSAMLTRRGHRAVRLNFGQRSS